MAEWEDKVIFKDKREELIFYRCFIDDLFFFLIWAGPAESLLQFLQVLNNNNNIKLTSHWHTEEINFLDVSVYRQNDRLKTKVYFKATDRNSYLPSFSGRRPLWLKNIPKEQIMRVRRNCSEDTNFILQSETLTVRFEARGYDPQYLEKVIEEVGSVSRDICLRERDSHPTLELNKNKEWGFILWFHAQYKEV